MAAALIKKLTGLSVPPSENLATTQDAASSIKARTQDSVAAAMTVDFFMTCVCFFESKTSSQAPF